MTFAFVVLRLSGDPALLIMSVDAPPEAIAAFRKAWGLDQPIWEQYLAYIGHALTGDFGKSMRDGRPAIELVLERVPATLAHHPAGAGAQDRPRHSRRHLCRAASQLDGRPADHGARRSRASPCRASCSALVLVLVFAVQLGWLPSGGSDSWRHAILPIVTLGIGGAAILARFTRSAMLEVLGQPYIRAASAKGVTWRARRDAPCAAQRRDPDRHHRRLHGRQPGRRRRGGRKRLRLARRRAAAGVGRRQPRSRGGAGHPDGDRGLDGDRPTSSSISLYGWLDPRVRGAAAAH